MANIVKANKPGKLGKPGKVDWKDKLAKYAKQVQEAAPVSGTYASFTDSSGDSALMIGGKQMDDDKADIVLLSFVCENQFYSGPYNRGDPKPPSCYAIGKNEKELVPHEKAVGYWDDKQEEYVKPDSCAECPMNEWGSADNGQGKKCKNTRLIAFISSNGLESPEDVEGADVVKANIAPTGIKPFNTYLRACAQQFGHPMFCVSELKAEDKVGILNEQQALDESLWPALEQRHEALDEDLMSKTHPDTDPDVDPTVKPNKGKPGKNKPKPGKPSKFGK